MTRQVILIAGEPQEFYEVSDFFRLLAADAPLKVEFYSQGREVSEAVDVSKGYAEKFDRGTFDRVRLVSDTTQAVQFVTRLGNVVLYDAAPVGDTAIVSSVPLPLDAATLLTMGRPQMPEAHWKDTSTLVANTPLTVFAPGANVNGALIWSAQGYENFTSAQNLVFIAKASAPANVADGEVIAQAIMRGVIAGTECMAVELLNPTRIAAGLGLYLIASSAGAAGRLRNARYTLL